MSDVSETTTSTTVVAASDEKKRAPVVRNSTQRNGVQFYIHRDQPDSWNRWYQTITAARNRLAFEAEEDKIDGLLINFPWWKDDVVELVQGIRELPVRQKIKDGFVAMWTDPSHAGVVFDILHNAYGIPADQISTQLTIDYSTRYCTFDHTGSVVQHEYESPFLTARKVAENEGKEDVYRGVERVSANITDTEYRTLTRPTTETLVVGYIGDASKLFANTPQCRIPPAVWHVNVFEEMAKTRKQILEARHPVQIRQHIESAFKASVRILELFDSSNSNFQAVAPFAPGIYYNPITGKARESQPVDLTLLLTANLENKFTLSQVDKMMDLVAKILNPNVTDKGRQAANAKLLSMLYSAEGSWLHYLTGIQGVEQLTQLLGVSLEDDDNVLETINFFSALQHALSNVFMRGNVLREKKRSVKKVDGVEKPRRGFNLPSQVSDELAAFVGTKEIPRTQVNKLINEYVKTNGLKCEEPGKKRCFVPDETLRSILGTEEGQEVDFFSDLPKLLNHHFPASKKRRQEEEAAAAAQQQVVSA